MDNDIHSLLHELHSDKWIVRGTAIHKLASSGPDCIEALPRLFDLLFDEHAPVQSYSAALIRKMGSAAVPLLLRESCSDCPIRRAQAIDLLMHTGSWPASTFRLADPILEPRKSDRPDWNGYVAEVMTVFQQALSDIELEVRFAGASALEEFGELLENTVPVFIEVLSRGEPQQQMWAAVRLGRIGPMAKSACNVLRQVIAREINDIWERSAHTAARNALKVIERE
jgi:HEAT repeat protein